MPPIGSVTTFRVTDYNLGETLNSGQAFRWHELDVGWCGVIHGRWLHLRQDGDLIHARTAESVKDWHWLEEYLQIGLPLGEVLKSFPDDPAMNESVATWRGLRLLKQEPWECLASFLMSSTKQIVQIRQIIWELCVRHGQKVDSGIDGDNAFAFPTARTLAVCSEAELRRCKMGFRAPYLLETAVMIDRGDVRLDELFGLLTAEARAELMRFPGVGRKIADCVLLFAYGRQDAFPVDVWVMKVLREAYFPRRKPGKARLERFIGSYFGPNAGYAQQYLFHHWRMKAAANRKRTS